jgi:signal transduction histidine kinase
VQASDRQLSAMNALLETYATPAQMGTPQPEPIEFSTLSQSVLQNLAPLLAANQAKITPQIPANLPPVFANADQIQRVVSHLVAATLQHNPPGLHLTLAAAVEAGMLRCTLQDDGRGWNTSDCDRFFELQVRSPHACCSTSLGVQLHRCQQIVRAYGGEIGVANAEPAGGILWFTLPLATTNPNPRVAIADTVGEFIRQKSPELGLKL